MYRPPALPSGAGGPSLYAWNATGRKNAAQEIREDTRNQPKAEEEIDWEPDIRPIPSRGGVVLFSGAQLHSTVPNTSGVTRFSLDFRTVNYDDVVAGHGAPNQDWECTGTSLRDFMSCADRSPLPEEVIAPYDTGPKPADGVLVYKPLQGD